MHFNEIDNRDHAAVAPAEAVQSHHGAAAADPAEEAHGQSDGPCEGPDVAAYTSPELPSGYLTIFDFVSRHAPGMVLTLRDPAGQLLTDSHRDLAELSEVLDLPVHMVTAPPIMRAQGVETVPAHQAGVFLGLRARWGSPF